MKDKLPPFIEVYRVLIATLPISTTEEVLDQSSTDLITLLTDWSKDLDFNVEVQPVSRTRNKFNMLASYGQGASGSLLAGHTDTVSFGDGRWTRDPFTLTEYNGKLYDLGTADMKGFFALILSALRNVGVTKPTELLYILATAGEETSIAGVRYFIEATALRPGYVVIGEPTSLQPIHAHKGRISSAIRIQGQPGHSSDPACGANAIELMHDVVGHTLQLHDNLKECYYYDVFTVPYPTLNLGCTRDGDASSCICACCELHMDIHPLPGMALSELNGLFNDALAPTNERRSDRLTVDELHPSIPGYECSSNHQPVGVIGKLLGARTEVVNYCAETPFIQTLCPTLVLGPGSINQAYRPDEHLETGFIKSTRELIAQVIHRFYWH